PRFLVRGFKPYDPVELARRTEEIVCRGDKRKYTHFYATGVYGGIATGYIVGCCLRCFYCWSDLSRDFPEFYGEFYSPREAMERIVEAARAYGVSKARISGGEPTLCRKHLIGLLERFHETDLKLFILETNGILFGHDKSYVREISRFERIHVRVSLKAGDPEHFTARTGAVKEAFELPFKAIEHLLDYGVSFHVAAMTDPRIMSREERLRLIQRLAEIDKHLAMNLEEEIIDPYDATLVRLCAYGIDPAKFFKTHHGD
ncbi:molybdenum cofactor biosynthesis protein MoaA, partial [Candidatus Geothermarchaeota archaeon ex4572_27]